MTGKQTAPGAGDAGTAGSDATISGVDYTLSPPRRQIRPLRVVCAEMLACCERNRHGPRFVLISERLAALVARWERRGR